MIHTYNRWTYIVNPNTGKVVKLTGKTGKMVMANYIATLERLANKDVKIKNRSVRKKKRSRKKRKKKNRRILKAVSCPTSTSKQMKKKTNSEKSPPAIRPYDDWRNSPSVSPILESSPVMEELTPVTPSPGDDGPEPLSTEPDTPSPVLSPFTADETPDPIASTPTPSPFDKEPAPGPVAPEPVAPEPVAPEPVAPEPVAPVPVAPVPVAPVPVAPVPAADPMSEPASPFEDEPTSETPIDEEKTPEGIDDVAASAAKAATDALSSVKASVVNLFSPSVEKSPATETPSDPTP